MIEVELIGGPQDGRTLSVPPHCHELRFPTTSLMTAAQYEAAADPMHIELMPVVMYQRGHLNPDGVMRFFYAGER